MSETDLSKKITKREIRFAWHIPGKDGYRDDAHYIKEQITYEDGSIEPRTFLLKDFERPIWITKPAFRNHKEKKEFEFTEKLHQYKTTETNKNALVAKSLEQPYNINKPKELKKSPYVYGYDITSTSLIKLKSLIKNKQVQSPYTICTLDIEATPIPDNQMLLITVAMKDKAYTAVVDLFLDKNSEKKHNLEIKKRIDKYIPKYKDFPFEFGYFDTSVQAIKAVFSKVHQWKPDILAVWNMDYDIPFILEELKKAKIDPKYVIADPTIPLPYRLCEYKKGINKKATPTGVKPLPPSLQWHTLKVTASFYAIDAMCLYRQLRMAKQEEPSYGLDAILKKEKIGEKLKFTEADHLSKKAWHVFMQEKYKYEYVVYNLYDTLCILELDDKTLDMQSKLPAFASLTDFAKFNSNPKKIVDALFLFGLERDRVIGTVGEIAKPKEMEDIDDDEVLVDYDSYDTPNEYDEDEEERVEDYQTLDLKNWIQTLPQNNLILSGLRCLADYPNVVTAIRAFIFDADVSSSYPSVTNCCNVSKSTTLTEVIDIIDVDELTFREANLGLIVGDSNIIDYFTVMFNMPDLHDLWK